MIISPAAFADFYLSAINKGKDKVARFSLYHGEFVTTGQVFHNPYNSEEVALDAVIITPEGKEIIMALFFQSSVAGKSYWGLNFSPREVGPYKYYVKARYQENTIQTKTINFQSLPSDNKGFLHQDANLGSWVYDNGKRFRGVGLNLAWEARLSIDDNPKYDYQYLLAQMKKNNINLVRTWVNAPWNLPLEWLEPNFGRYQSYDGIGLHPQGIKRIDYLIEHAEKNNIHLMLTMDYHGSLWAKDFDNWGNDHWKNHPYNIKNGGPARTPEEFFTHPQAISRYKDRLRYIIARWGYSTQIAALEFWNEVDNAVHKKGQNIADKAVTGWHQVMVDYLAEIDPYQHIKTTSISHKEIAGLFDIEGLDFTQSHLYGRTTKEMEQYVIDYSTRYNKSYVIGEASVGWDGVNDNIDAYALALHEQLWALMFSKTPILPLTWWWQAYDKHEKLFHLKHAANFINRLTGSDSIFHNSLAVTLPKGVMHRSLTNGTTNYIWLKNLSDKTQDIALSIQGKTKGDFVGEFQYSHYNTWTGKTTPQGKITADDNQLRINLLQLPSQRDILIIFGK